jgi:hypothetical protein
MAWQAQPDHKVSPARMELLEQTVTTARLAQRDQQGQLVLLEQMALPEFKVSLERRVQQVLRVRRAHQESKALPEMMVQLAQLGQPAIPEQACAR